MGGLFRSPKIEEPASAAAAPQPASPDSDAVRVAADAERVRRRSRRGGLATAALQLEQQTGGASAYASTTGGA